MPGFLAETSKKLLWKGWGTILILKANCQNVKQKFHQEWNISTEVFGLFCLHKAQKCLLLPGKQFAGGAQRCWAWKKNKKTCSPGTALPLQIFKSCACSQRRPSCWELQLANGDLGLIFGSAFHSLWTSGKPRTAAGPVLWFISSDCSFLR